LKYDELHDQNIGNNFSFIYLKYSKNISKDRAIVSKLNFIVAFCSNKIQKILKRFEQ